MWLDGIELDRVGCSVQILLPALCKCVCTTISYVNVRTYVPAYLLHLLSQDSGCKGVIQIKEVHSFCHQG